MTPFFGEVGIDPLTEPGLVVAPLQALTDEDLTDPAAPHRDAVVGQVARLRGFVFGNGDFVPGLSR
jgi:hypothetical protein